MNRKTLEMIATYFPQISEHVGHQTAISVDSAGTTIKCLTCGRIVADKLPIKVRIVPPTPGGPCASVGCGGDPNRLEVEP
jgi:ribosomal protein S27E